MEAENLRKEEELKQIEELEILKEVYAQTIERQMRLQQEQDQLAQEIE